MPSGLTDVDRFDPFTGTGASSCNTTSMTPCTAAFWCWHRRMQRKGTHTASGAVLLPRAQLLLSTVPPARRRAEGLSCLHSRHGVISMLLLLPLAGTCSPSSRSGWRHLSMLVGHCSTPEAQSLQLTSALLCGGSCSHFAYSHSFPSRPHLSDGLPSHRNSVLLRLRAIHRV